MSNPSGRDLVLDLERIEELFDAPDANPFNDRELEILGESGIDHIGKRIKAAWPRRRAFDRIVLTLPASQVTPDAAERARVALRRTCAAQLEQNRYLRKQAMRIGKRQMGIALVILAIDVVVLFWIASWPNDGMPGFLAGILAILAIFAGSLAIWDAIESLAFNWVPFVLDNACLNSMSELELVLAPRDGAS